MPSTPLLGITEVAPNQNQKEVTINAAIGALEAAIAATLTVSFAGGATQTLSATQFTRNFIFKATAASAPATLRVPATINGNNSSRVFVVRNASGQGLTVVSATGGGTSVAIANGESRLLDIDGSNNIIVAAEPATVTTFLSLVDTPDAFTGQGGKVLTVTEDETALEFVESTNALAGLSDVDLTSSEPEDGNALIFDLDLGKWVPGVFEFSSSFTDLEDTFDDYEGMAKKFVRVNLAEDGLEPADAKLSELTDCPTEDDMVGNSGKVLAVNLTEDGYILIAAGAGSGETNTTVGTHRYWRLSITDSADGSVAGFAEIVFFDQDNNPIADGTTSASSQFSGTYSADKARDANNATYWATTEGGFVSTWTIDFATEKDVKSIQIKAGPDPAHAHAPTNFTVQYSDDGATWYDAQRFGKGTWEDGEAQNFDFAVRTRLIHLTDVDLSVKPTEGQSLVYDAASSTWKAGDVEGGGGGGADSLIDLDDVDLITTPPEDGQALVWNEGDSKWVPGEAPSGVDDLDDLGDVDLTTPPTNGQALVWNEGDSKWVPGNAEPAPLNLVTVTADHTVDIANGNRQYITVTDTTAKVVTVPNNSAHAFPVGTEIFVEQGGGGKVTIDPDSGVTVNSRDSAFETFGLFSVVALIKKATNIWTLTGDLLVEAP